MNRRSRKANIENEENTPNLRSSRKKSRYGQPSTLLDRRILEAQTTPKPVRIPPTLGGCPCTSYSPTPYSYELVQPKFRYVSPAPVTPNRYAASYYPTLDTLDRHRYTGNYRSLVDQKVMEAQTNKLMPLSNKPCYIPPSYRYYPSTCKTNVCCQSPLERVYNLEKFYDEAKRYGHERKYTYTPCTPTPYMRSDMRASYRPLSNDICSPLIEANNEPLSYTEQEDEELSSGISENHEQIEEFDTGGYGYPSYIEKEDPSRESTNIKTQDSPAINITVEKTEKINVPETENTEPKVPESKPEDRVPEIPIQQTNITVKVDNPAGVPAVDTSAKAPDEPEKINVPESANTDPQVPETTVQQTITVKVDNPVGAPPADTTAKTPAENVENIVNKTVNELNTQGDKIAEGGKNIQDTITVQIGNVTGNQPPNENIKTSSPNEQNVAEQENMQGAGGGTAVTVEIVKPEGVPVEKGADETEMKSTEDPNTQGEKTVEQTVTVKVGNPEDGSRVRGADSKPNVQHEDGNEENTNGQTGTTEQKITIKVANKEDKKSVIEIEQNDDPK